MFADSIIMRSLAALVVVMILAAGTSNSASILGIVPTPSISHQLPFRLIALELARKGHHVTLITTDPLRRSIENYTEIDVSMTYEYLNMTFDFSTMLDITPVETMQIFPIMGKEVCEIQLGSEKIKEFLRSQRSFDVVVVEMFMFQCYYGLVHKLGSPPMIGYLSVGPHAPALAAMGNPNNPVYSLDFMVEYTDHMTFWQRLYNVYTIIRFLYTWNYVVMPSQEEIMRKHFGPGPPSVWETEKNYSLLLLNNHFSVNYPRPLLPNIVEMTGLHLEKQRKPLPKDIQSFLDGATHGVIYISFGTNVKGSAMPEDKRRTFLEAFAQLPQRVLWKWEVDSLPGQPKNVMIAKWLPQQDVLAHPNIRLFITQGGLQSMNEASYFAVPMIGIPFIGDQQHNVAKMEQTGIGYRMRFREATTDTVLKAIHTVLHNSSYRENMKRFSAVFREHQETSLERATWWIEYVIRHKGAPHMRSAALDLSWWKLLLLDVIALPIISTAVAFYLLYKTVRCCRKSAHSFVKQRLE